MKLYLAAAEHDDYNMDLLVWAENIEQVRDQWRSYYNKKWVHGQLWNAKRRLHLQPP